MPVAIVLRFSGVWIAAMGVWGMGRSIWAFVGYGLKAKDLAWIIHEPVGKVRSSSQ